VIVRTSDFSLSNHVGQEGDVQVLWTVRASSINVGLGRLFPGEFLKRTTPGVPYNVVFVNVVHRF
jgi:hypothetical protein